MDYSKVFFVVLAKLNIILAFSKNKPLLHENLINTNVKQVQSKIIENFNNKKSYNA